MEVISLNSLPLGFRFRPTDEELIHHFLRLKINGKNDDVRVIREVDVCKWEPWDLPDMSAIETRDKEWFFFCPLDRKYPNGSRLNRATGAGYWKATGKDRKVKSGNNLIGMKKTLVFYTGRAPKGTRTNWVMHEYRATEEDLAGTLPGQSAFVLCKLFNKQDENTDEVEPSTSSSVMVKSSPGDTPSELEFPQVCFTSDSQVEKHAENAESSRADISDKTTPDTLAPALCCSNSNDACDVEDLVAEVTDPEVDPQLEHDLALFYDPSPLDSKLFSPLHSQLQAEIGSSCMFHSVTGDLSNNHGGMQLQYGTNDSDALISEFLDSILNCPDEYFCDESSVQRYSAIGSETLNKLTIQQQLEAEYSGSLSCEAKADASTPSLMETMDERKLVLKEDVASSGSASSQMNNLFSAHQEVTLQDEISGTTGIRIRSRQPQNQPRGVNFMVQGAAPRRLRLQCRLSDPRSVESECPEVKLHDKKENTSQNDDKVGDFATSGVEKGQMDMVFKSKNIGSTCNWFVSMYSKAPSARRTASTYALLLTLTVVALIFLISACTWRALEIRN